MAKYSETPKVEAGQKFKTVGGAVVQTTGNTQKIESHNLYVHEVEIVDGVGKGYKYLHNLDNAQKL